MRTTTRALLRRAGIGTATGIAAVLLAASAASAHVKVSGDVQQGGSGVITFRAPSESATASTTELTVTFPTTTPIVSVDTQPMAGWAETVSTAKLAKPVKTDDGEIDSYVSKVDWKATSSSAAVPPGQFQLFNLSVSGLPDVSSLSFPALQYYSDGSTVNWNETATGSAEPEHPAPVLTLGPVADATPAPSEQPSVSATTASGTSDTNMSDSSGAGWTGVVGLVAGVLGLILGGIALARTARKQPSAQ